MKIVAIWALACVVYAATYFVGVHVGELRATPCRVYEDNIDYAACMVYEDERLMAGLESYGVSAPPREEKP